MTRFNIYQINSDRDTKDVKFWGYDFTMKHVGFIDFSIYDDVYTNTMEVKSLNEIFEIFNINHPEDFKGHSLSVSDVVEIYESDKIESGVYFCDNIGWRRVN